MADFRNEAKHRRAHFAPPESERPPVSEEHTEPPVIPPPALAERIAAQVLIHLLRGRWSYAVVAVNAGELEAREIAGAPNPKAMTIGERRALHVEEMCLPVRVAGGLHRVGLATVGEVVDAWPLVGENFARHKLGIEFRTLVARVLREWNLLSQEQVREALAERLILRWWARNRPVDQ